MEDATVPDRRVRRWRVLDGGRQPAARRLRAAASPARSARGSASSPRRRATPTTTSCASTARSPPSAASRATCRCSAATAARRSTGDLGEHLLAQDLIYVGGGSVISLLGAWRAHGIDAHPAPRRGGAAWCSAGSAPARCAGSPRRSPPSTGAPQARRRPRPAAVLQLRALRRRAEPARGVPPLRRATGCARGYAADDGAALHFVGTELQRVVASRPRPARASASRCAAIASSSASCRPSTSARPLALRRVRTRSSRWAAAASPRSPATRRSTSSCSQLAGAPRAADPLPADGERRPARSDRRASTPPSATARASPRCCRSSAWATCAGRCATSSSPRTSSTSAAARCATCWRIWQRPRPATACCARRGSAASCSPGSAPARCAGSRAA